VIDPCSMRPARSRISGSSEKTLGGIPWSPAAPGGQPDLPLRVTQPRQRIDQQTARFSPGRGSTPAMVQAVLAERTRNSGASSLVLTMTTHLPQTFFNRGCAAKIPAPAAAARDQRHHRHVRAGVARDLRPSAWFFQPPGRKKFPSAGLNRRCAARSTHARWWRLGNRCCGRRIGATAGHPAAAIHPSAAAACHRSLA